MGRILDALDRAIQKTDSLSAKLEGLEVPGDGGSAGGGGGAAGVPTLQPQSVNIFVPRSNEGLKIGGSGGEGGGVKLPAKLWKDLEKSEQIQRQILSQLGQIQRNNGLPGDLPFRLKGGGG